MTQRRKPVSRPRGGYVRSAVPSTPRMTVASRRKAEGEQVEGRQSVRELLKARVRKTHEIYLDQGVDRTGIVEEIVSLALKNRVPVKEISGAKFDSMCRSEGAQGVLALADPVRFDSSESWFTGSDGGGRKHMVVLDHVTDPRNLGAVLRSAECAGFSYVVLPERRSCGITPTVTKAAAGAIEYLRFAYVSGVPAFLEQIKKFNAWSVGLDPGAPDSLWSVSLRDTSFALVVGSEGKGLARLVRQRCDYLVSIPQAGQVESLNVSAAATVAMFTLLR